MAIVESRPQFASNKYPLPLLKQDPYDLPSLQVIDFPTAKHFREKYLDDINSAKKINNIEGFEGYTPWNWEIMAKYIPKKDYFQDSDHAEGIHGIPHAIRVMLNVLPLAYSEGLNERKTEIVVAAASLHDIARIDDRVDNGHGERAANWIHENREYLISEGYEFNTSEFEMIEALVTYHESDYANIPDHVKNKYQRELLVIMGADGLERFRSPNDREDLGWWPNPKYFQLLATQKLYDGNTAMTLCLESQFNQFMLPATLRRLFRNEDPIIYAIRSKAKQLGYIN